MAPSFSSSRSSSRSPSSPPAPPPSLHLQIVTRPSTFFTFISVLTTTTGLYPIPTRFFLLFLRRLLRHAPSTSSFSSSQPTIRVPLQPSLSTSSDLSPRRLRPPRTTSVSSAPFSLHRRSVQHRCPRPPLLPDPPLLISSVHPLHRFATFIHHRAAISDLVLVAVMFVAGFVIDKKKETESVTCCCCCAKLIGTRT